MSLICKLKVNRYIDDIFIPYMIAMRDIIKRFGIIVVYGALLAYIVYLYGVGATIVQ